MPTPNSTKPGELLLPDAATEQQQRQQFALEQREADSANGVLDLPSEQEIPQTAADAVKAEVKRDVNGHDGDLMEKIAAKQRRRSNAAKKAPLVDDASEPELELPEEEHDDPLEVAQEPGATHAPAQVPATQDEVVRGFYTNEKGERFLRATVDGKIVDLPESAVLTYVQKNESGDRKLREAAERKQQLDDQEQRLRQQQTSTPQPSAQDVASVDVNQLMQKRQETYLRMYNGDETAIPELAQLDAQMLAMVNKPAPQLDIDAVLTERESKKRLADWSGRVNADEVELLNDPAYADLTGSDTAYGLLVAEAGRLTKAQDAINNGLRPLDIMHQAAANIRAVFNPAPAAAVDSRTQRKQALGNTAITAGTQGSVQQRQRVPAEVPDGGSSPAGIRNKGFAELRATKGRNA